MAKHRQKQAAVQYKGQVVWILEASSLSGGVRCIYEMARGLLNKGWEQMFFSLNERPNWWDTKRFGWKQFKNYDEMLPHIKALPPQDKVLASWWKTALVLEAAKHPNSYYLVQDLESSYYSAQNFQRTVMNTYTLGLKMFTTSHWVETSLFGVEYVGIGFRPDNFKPTRKDRHVMTIGRKQQIKGFSYLVEMVQRLTKELAMPIVITSLDKTVDLGGMSVTKVGLSDQQMATEYGKSLYYICTSQHEGFGLPILEAMASGCCVVTTACDGPENNFCVDGENCLIVSRDDPREMVAALRKLDTNAALRDKLIAGGIAMAKQWEWKPVFDRLDAYLENS